jgi:hypothetical protein
MTPPPLIDPKPEELTARLDAAAGSPGRDWGDVLRLLEARREGVVTVDAGVPFGVCWWADRLGRRHWALPRKMECMTYKRHTRVGDVSVGWCETRHPLEWIAPPLSCGWRERVWRREFVMICRCGVIGTPEALAWMGQTCGPCFDREQDDMVPTPHPEGHIKQLLLAPSGRLVVIRMTDLDSEAAWRTVLAAYDPPFNGPPVWEHDVRMYCHHAAASDSLVAIGGHEGEVDLLDLRDGVCRQQFEAGSGGIRNLAFAGTGHGTLVVLEWGTDGMQFWDVRQDVPRRTHGVTCRWVHGLAVNPNGSRVAAFGSRDVEVFDGNSGQRVERLTPRIASIYSGVYLSDGSLCLPDGGEEPFSADDPDPWYRSRWEPDTGPPGFLARLFRLWARGPDLSVPVEWSWFLATDGRMIVANEGPLRIVDGQTLRPVATFLPGNRESLDLKAALAPGNDLILASGHTLTAWPWRELFAVE